MNTTKFTTAGAVCRQGLMALCAGLLLAACSPGSGGSGNTEDGRKRLNANTSYADFGDYVVHVNAMTTDSLTPEIAQNYAITRSEDLGLINLVVLKKSEDLGVDKPVSTEVKLSVANLTGQLKSMQLKEVIDGDSIYQIGTLPVDNRETINFDFDIRPAESDRTLMVRFSHEFYTR